VDSSCELCNGPSGSVKCWEFLAQPHNGRLVVRKTAFADGGQSVIKLEVVVAVAELIERKQTRGRSDTRGSPAAAEVSALLALILHPAYITSVSLHSVGSMIFALHRLYSVEGAGGLCRPAVAAIGRSGNLLSRACRLSGSCRRSISMSLLIPFWSFSSHHLCATLSMAPLF
jgi:hypothetical protein